MGKEDTAMKAYMSQNRVFADIFNFYVTVQDGGKMRAKTGVKLAYKRAFALIFTSDGHPMLLARPWQGKKIPAVLNSYIFTCIRESR